MTTATLVKENKHWGGSLTVHDHHGGTWWRAGRHGAGEAAESPTSLQATGSGLSLGHILSIYETSKPAPP